MQAMHGLPSNVSFEIYSVSDGKNCELTYWAICPNNYIFSQLVSFILELDYRIRWVGHYWLCPQMKILLKFHNLWDKCHLIKWLEMQQYVIKKKLCQKYERYQKKLQHLSEFRDLFWCEGFAPLWHPTYKIFHEAESE